MKDRSGQFNVTKVARTLLHVLVAGRALEASIDGAHARITKPIFSRKLLCVVLYCIVSVRKLIMMSAWHCADVVIKKER